MRVRADDDLTTTSAMRETLARFEAILASTLDPIVTINAQGRIISVSDSIRRVFGYSPDDLVGKNISILMPEPHRSRHDDYLATYLRTGTTHILGKARELVAEHKDGHTFPVEISVSRVDVPGQDDPLFTGIIHDLTQRKQQEEQLRIISNLTLGINSAGDLNHALHYAVSSLCESAGWDYGEAWLASPDQEEELVLGPTWLRCSDQFSQFLEQSRRVRFMPGAGLIGRAWQERAPVWVDDVTALSQNHFVRRDAAVRTGIRSALAVPILGSRSVENPDGRVVAVLAFFVRQVREQDEQQVEVVKAALAPLGPVIERKQFEDALAESERRFRKMLDDVEVIALMMDTAGRITFADRYLLEMTGWSSGEVNGCDWFDMFVPDDQRDTVRTMFRQSMIRGKIARRYENDIITRSGERRRIAWSNTIMRDPDGKVVGATALGVDVTEQRRAEIELACHREQLEQLVEERTAELKATHDQLRLTDRLASIGTLAAGLGHDMNNVLLTARCNLDALEAAFASEQFAPARSAVTDCEDCDSTDRAAEVHSRDLFEPVISLRRSVNYLQQLTDGLRLFALDPADDDATGELTDIAHWWEQVGPLLRRAIPKHAELTYTVPDDLPHVQVAPHRLTQAVLNLIVNSGEAVDDDGQIRLRIGLTRDRRHVRLSVVDNGCGMSEDVKRQALDPFFTTKKRGLGTGLGLSLVRGMAESSGGSVRIHSSPGRGTAVVIVFPVAAPRRAKGPDISPTAFVSIADARMATFIGAMVASSGYEVRHLDADGTPDADGLWIAEPAAETFAELQTFISRPSNRLVLFGDDRLLQEALVEHGQNGNVFIVDDFEDFEMIREVLSQAIASEESRN